MPMLKSDGWKELKAKNRRLAIDVYDMILLTKEKTEEEEEKPKVDVDLLPVTPMMNYSLGNR